MSTSSMTGREGVISAGEVISNSDAAWPLKFSAHQFGAACYSTYGCRVNYGHYYPGDSPDDVLMRSSASVDGYPGDVLHASWGAF